MTIKKTVLMSLLAVAALAATAWANTYNIDVSHSSVGFKVKHMMVSNVRGAFTEFEGTFTFDEDSPQAASVEAVIQVASVNTNDEKRDEHLRSPDFFNAAENPTMTFESTKLESKGGGEFLLHGNLTLNGVTKPVTLEAEFAGLVNDPWGNTRVGFEAEGEIDRKDFGIVWSKTMDGGGLVVGDKVEIELEIEGIAQQ